MKRGHALSLLAALCLTGMATADSTPPKKTFQYVGVGKCKRCHTTAKIGGQYKVWLESKHAHAFFTLAGDSAKSIAAARGVKDPQHAAECLQCHVTGYGEPADHFVTARADSEGVGCESCHGAGSEYWQKSVMKNIRTGKADAATYGLTLPTKETCANCHNEKSPRGTPVDWPADSAKIAHPIPQGYTVDDE